MISRSATETATQFCITAAASARPIHRAEASQIFSIPNPSFARTGERRQNRDHQRPRPATRTCERPKPGARRATENPPDGGLHSDPTARPHAAGVISPCGRLRGYSIPWLLAYHILVNKRL